MRISVILEALLILAFLAFASARVIEAEGKADNTGLVVSNRQEEIIVSDDDFTEVNPSPSEDIVTNEVDAAAEQVIASPETPLQPAEPSPSVVAEDVEASVPVNVDDDHPINRYCTCNADECNCCREFKLPLVSIRGPGCATVRYLERNKLSVAIKYGDITLTQRVISGRKATPICMPLPGGYSRFCGRVYGITRQKEDFKACLGLELRAQDEVEAALRVSCFNFGPKGLSLSNAEPLPPPAEAESDDDDDDDILGGLVGGDDDDDDEEETGGGGGGGVLGFADDEEEEEEEDDYEDDDAEEGASDSDYTGFSLLGGDIIDGLFGTDSNRKKKPAVSAIKQANRKKLNTEESQVVKKVPAVTAAPVKAVKPKKPLKSVANKVIIKNSPGILNSAQITQNEIDSSANKPEIVEVTTKKNKKPESSLLDVVGAFVGDDDDDTVEEADDDEEDVKEEEEEEDEKDDEEEEVEYGTDVEDDAEAEEEADEESEEGDEEDEEEQDDKKKATTAKAITNKKTNNKKKTNYGLGLLGLARFFKLI
ncbi:uncharacterized protein DMENIID0001_107530 [Sergentomyia squamirostris]